MKIGDIAWYNDKVPDPLGHKNHHKGTCVDIRLFRSDDSNYEAKWNKGDDRKGKGHHYDRELTSSFIKFVKRNFSPSDLIFNDPKIKGITRSRGHDDHIHLCFE